MTAMVKYPRATYADYLAVEHNSEVRHEFVDGVIVAMAGGSFERRVKVYRRERGDWTSHSYRDGDQLALPRLDREILVDEIYDGIIAPGGPSLLR